MVDFSIRDSLIKLKDKKYSNDIYQTINFLVENYDEEQLRIMSMYHGLKIDNKNIRLNFYNNVGFRCYNENNNIVGNLPICNNINNFMNKLYMEYVEESINETIKNQSHK